jgi:hypothetical protein
LSWDFIVNKYVDIQKRLALSEYKRNKDKKKSKRITNDLYEEYEILLIEKQKQPIGKHQDKQQPIITNEDFERNLKRNIDDNKDIEDNKKSDNQQVNDYSPSFKLISKIENKNIFFHNINDQ